MYRHHSASVLNIIFLAVAVTVGCSVQSQTRQDAASLSKNAFTWSQEDLQLGFLHYDAVFPAHEVPRGGSVRKLPQGQPIAAFTAGGEHTQTLDDFITEQHVAGLLVLQDGRIRLERYALGLSRDGRWTSQSVAKSVTSTLVGAAIRDGYIGSVDNLVTDYLPDLRGSAYEKVTIRHLLTMTSGVRWTEIYSDPNSDIVRYYSEPIEPGMDEAVSYMRKLPAEAEPGEKWNYKTGETNLLGVLVMAATGQTLSEYLSEKIWKPYGMEQDASWLVGRTDRELAGCCLQAALRDYARYGQFVLDGGRIDGSPIVPDGWFAEATKSQVMLWPGWGYGYQWWTLSDGTFRALGIHGQMIHIDPARRLVIVISSAWPEADNYMRHMAETSFVNRVVGVLDRE